MMENMILESVDLLLRAAHAGTYKALADELHCHPSTVGDKVSYALVIFKRATGAEYTNLNPKGILTGFEKLCADDQQQKDPQGGKPRGGRIRPLLRQYIAKQDPALWVKVPHTGALPTPEELIAYLLERNEDKIIAGIYPHSGNTPCDFSPLYLNQLHKTCMQAQEKFFMHGCQIRVYDFYNELRAKYNCLNPDNARNMAVHLLEANAETYSRCIIRAVSPFSCEWYICDAVASKSPHYLCKNGSGLWQLVFYNQEDVIMTKQTSTRPLTRAQIERKMKTVNAMYCVLNHLYDPELKFIVQYYIMNLDYRLNGAAEIMQAAIDQNHKRFKTRYQRLLELDRDETAKLK